jgi:hypothetical protein
MDAQDIVDRLNANPDLEIGMLSAAEIYALRYGPCFTATMVRKNAEGRKVYTDLEDVSEDRLRRKVERLGREGWAVDRGQ